MLRSIANNGTPKQRVAALQTRATDNTFRATRAAAARVPAARALAVPGQKQRRIGDAHNEETLPGAIVRTLSRVLCGSTIDFH